MSTRRGPDNSVRAAIRGTISGQPWVNVFHAQLSTGSAITQADLDSWLNTFQANYKTRLGAHQPATVAFVSAQATLYTPNGGVLQSSVSMTGNGTSGTTEIKDASACKVITWLSTVYWRGGKPRTYLAGVGDTDLIAGSNHQIGSTEATSLTTAAANFRTDTNAQAVGTITGTSFGFVSFFTGKVARTPAVFFAITGAKVHPRIGTQRRRIGKWIL